MWISFTSQNGETVYLKHENVDIVEGLPAEGAVIIGEEKPKGGAMIFMVSGASVAVQESGAEVMQTVVAAENYDPDAEDQEFNPEAILGLVEGE